ncbi:MAG: methyltransferase domain-containing protein [Verrucomicrobiae bacterium]|nr:methyltransferase domain-containing protein [Verrucomicrobiae bacterium]
MKRDHRYVHGYSEREDVRLQDQAGVLAELLHAGVRYAAGERIFEAGCGVGAQTVLLARNSPRARFLSVDISGDSLRAAARRVRRADIRNVDFQQTDLNDLPFPPGSFDHVFVCFVLEHLSKPLFVLRRLKRMLKPGGSLTVIEGDHDSTLFHPWSEKAWKTIQCLIDLQARAGGDSLIGRQLFPLLKQAGFRKVKVSPRFVYADASRPEWVRGFTRNTYIAMVEAARDEAIRQKMISPAQWREGIRDLRRAAGKSGVFCYTFFKAVAVLM